MIAIDGIGLASRILSAVALAAGTDETRPHLNAVLVRVRSKVLDVVATNGHILARYTGANDAKDCETLISLAGALQIAKASRKAALIELDVEKRIARVYDHGRGTNTAIEWAPVGAQFPPIDQVIPACGTLPKAGLEGFAVSTEYLIVAGKMFAILENTKARSAGVYLEIPKDELSPIVLSSASIPNLVLVVMPNREGRGPARKVEKPAKVKAA